MSISNLYPGGDNPVTVNLGLALYDMSYEMAENFIILDAAVGSGSSVRINSAVIPNVNFVNSATVTFSVAGSNVSATAASGGTPGGSNGDIQYNNGSGGFGGDAGFTWTTSSQTLRIGSTTNQSYFDLETTPILYTENTENGIVGTSDGPFTFPYLFATFLNPSSTSAIECFNVEASLAIQPACAQNFTSELCGFHGEGDHNGTGTVFLLIGVAAEAYNLGAGTVTTLTGLNSDVGTLNAGSGAIIGTVNGLFTAINNKNGNTITNAYGVHIGSPNTGGTISNYTALQIDVVGTPTGGYPNPMAIVVAGGNVNLGPGITSANSIRLSDGVLGSQLALTFTSEPDLGLYRVGASALGIAGGGFLLEQIDAAFGVTILSSSDLGFSPTQLASGRTANLHLVAPGVVGVGTGALGNTGGTLKCATVNATSSYQANGTAGVTQTAIAVGTLATMEGIVTTFTAVSDERLKNATMYAGGLAEILAINPIRFTYNELGQKFGGWDKEHVYVGFSAQNVQKSIPEAIQGYEGEEKYLSFDDRPVIAALVNAVKELKAELDALKARK